MNKVSDALLATYSNPYELHACYTRQVMMVCVTMAPDVNSLTPTIYVTKMNVCAIDDNMDGVEDDNYSTPTPAKPSRRESRILRRSIAPATSQDATNDKSVPDVITDIKIVTDYDELQALKSSGYDVNCIQITPDGVLHNQEFLWKFYIMVQYKSYHDGIVGVEDLRWYRCNKSITQIPSIPGFDTIIAQDLTDGTGDVSDLLPMNDC